MTKVIETFTLLILYSNSVLFVNMCTWYNTCCNALYELEFTNSCIQEGDTGYLRRQNTDLISQSVEIWNIQNAMVWFSIVDAKFSSVDNSKS